VLSPLDIVLHYNGRKIENVRQFIHLVQDTPVGSSAKLEILRRGKPMTLAAVIQSRESRNRLEYLASNLQDAFGPIGAMMRQDGLGGSFRLPFGFDVIGLTPAVAAERQIQRHKGLLVTGIAEKTPADLAGIMSGDVILSLDEQPVDDVRKFSSYLQTLPPGTIHSMKVLRKGSEQTVSIQLPAVN